MRYVSVAFALRPKAGRGRRNRRAQCVVTPPGWTSSQSRFKSLSAPVRSSGVGEPAGWWEQTQSLRSSSLAPEGVERLETVIGEAITETATLHGGISASVCRVSTATRAFVLKRFVAPEIAAFEYERLQIATAVAVPTPEPVALDRDGEWFGAPALLVTYLPGRTLHPPDARALGRVLATIHATPVPNPVPAVLARPPLWARWEKGCDLPAGLEDAILELKRVAPGEPQVLAHCDFHPGNVLGDGAGTVIGVVDWANLRATPRGFDVGLTRCDLALDPGGDAPAVFLETYVQFAGTRVDHLPLWDALAASRAIEHGDRWVESWTAAGLEMTAELLRSRALAFASEALRAVSAG